MLDLDANICPIRQSHKFYFPLKEEPRANRVIELFRIGNIPFTKRYKFARITLIEKGFKMDRKLWSDKKSKEGQLKKEGRKIKKKNQGNLLLIEHITGMEII